MRELHRSLRKRGTRKRRKSKCGSNRVRFGSLAKGSVCLGGAFFLCACHLEKRIPGHDCEHDGADGEFANGSPDTARKSTATGSNSCFVRPAFPGFAEVRAEECTCGATHKGHHEGTEN